jgi:hypothetical protein
MKKDYTLYISKADGRTRSGWREVTTMAVEDLTEQEMAELAKLINEFYASERGLYQIEYYPTKVTVKNLMTGKDVEIDRDTPWCCNPASETYWSI